jgi:hypothetical protein
VTLFCLGVVLQQSGAKSLLLAMALSYVISLSGLVLAYISYRRRQKGPGGGRGEKREP